MARGDFDDTPASPDTTAEGMTIDGAGAVEVHDKSGEVISVEGIDDSLVAQGKVAASWEHIGPRLKDGSPNEGHTALDVVGKVTFSRKILTKADCQNERQRMYWDRIKFPFLYVVIRLFDAAGHPAAMALAAIIRDCVANDEPPLVEFSIEGATIEREGNRLLQTVMRRMTFTVAPCNKLATTGLVSDPQAPKGFRENPNDETVEDILASVVETRKGGSLDVPLGHRVRLQVDPICKTYDAGMPSGAPSTLTGGAALQRSSVSTGRSKRLAALAAAVSKHYDEAQHGPLRKYLAAALDKMQMPEVSDEFLDHYTDMVENHLRLSRRTLRKADGDAPAPAALPTKPPERMHAPPKAPKAGKPPLTFRGEPIKPNPDLATGKFEFDEDRGVLRTDRGTFHLYNPDADPHHADAGEKFKAIWHSPDVRRIHDYATQQWLRLHHALKNGNLPQAILGTAVAFSQLSPNTPVTVHELMAGHLYDTARQSGIDIHDPKFAGLRADWLKRDQPHSVPENGGDYWRGTLGAALPLQNDTTGNPKLGTAPRKAGDLPGFMLAENKFDNIGRYAQSHDAFVQTVRKHGLDARSAVADLMDAKLGQTRWDVWRKNRLVHGQPDPGPYAGAPKIHGLAQKTARFAYAMLGAGNSLVPDTHMVRHLFGLDKNLDGPTADYLKQRVMWQPKNTALLGAVDRWYFRNHPSVRYMRDHPQFGHHFQDDPEQAIFPAFWAHWLSISPHERELGHQDAGLAFNTLATHRPYFEEAGRQLDRPGMPTVGTAGPFARAVRKAESIPGGPLISPADAAELLHDWTQQLGHAGAMIRYYAHLVPLLYPDETLHPGVNLSALDKSLPFEAAVVDLRKAVIDVQSLRKDDQPNTRAERGAGVSARKASAVQPTWDGKVDSDIHGLALHNTAPEQSDLIHGLNLKKHAGPPKKSRTGITQPQWHRSPKGGLAIVKNDDADMVDAGLGHREVTYHNAMRDVLGLGEFVPTTAAFRHPESGEIHSAQRAVPGAEHIEYTRLRPAQSPKTDILTPTPTSSPVSAASGGETPPPTPGSSGAQADAMDAHDPEYSAAKHQIPWIQHHSGNGDMDKLLMANRILGNKDRHSGNFVLRPTAPHVQLVDHSHTFNYGNWTGDFTPAYYEAAAMHTPNFNEQPMHPAASAWLAGLSPQKLQSYLVAQGHKPKVAEQAARRVQYLQAAVRSGKKRREILAGLGYTTPQAETAPD